MESIIKQNASYTINEINPACFSIYYRLIKKGKGWGTIHYIRTGTDATGRTNHAAGSYTTHNGFSTKEKAMEAIETNEARLAKKNEQGK